MTQNINNDWTNKTEVMTGEGTLVQPFNPERVAELVNLVFTIPPIAFASVDSTDSRLIIGLPNPVTQEQIDVALVKLNAICVDPTRNDLTEDQIDNASVAAKLQAARTNRDTVRGPFTNGVQTAAGLKDHLTGNTAFSISLGWSDQLLTNSGWNALTADDQTDILRKVLKGAGGQKGVLDILLPILNILIDGSQADLTELRLIRDNLLNNQ